MATFGVGAVSKMQDENSEYWVSKFGQLIGGIGKVIAIVTDWESPVMLTRIWCLFEMYHCMRLQLPIVLAMTNAGDLDMMSAPGGPMVKMPSSACSQSS